MEAELVRIIILLETLYQQSTTIKYDLKQRLKYKFNNFDRQVESLLNDLKSNIKGDKAAEAYFEQQSILYLEILREFDKCKNPKIAVALFQAINEGLEVTVDGQKIETEIYEQ